MDVTNTGKRDGDEVVQLYVKHLGSKVARPRKELRGFRRVTLQPGETKTVELPLAAQSLAYWDENKRAGWSGPDHRLRDWRLVGRSKADHEHRRRPMTGGAPRLDNQGGGSGAHRHPISG